MRPHVVSVLQFGCLATLVAIDPAGIFVARRELARVFGIKPPNWPLPAQATFLNRYGFLKSVEFSAGLVCFRFRSSILADGRASAIFLFFVGVGVGIRTRSWIVDGRPAPLFIVFLALEACVLLAVFVHLGLLHGRG